MKLLNVLEEGEKALVNQDEKKHEIIINLIKRLYYDLDIYSESLIYIWVDNNRIKINMDGGKEVFRFKHGTRFSRMPNCEITDPGFIHYLEKQCVEFFKKRGVEIYNFYVDERKIIFKIKSFKNLDLEKCLY